MRLFVLPALGFLIVTASFPAPVLAQGQGGYAKGCPGAETVRMTVEERARARAARQTNDTNGGRSSIDKSCKTWENGGTIDGQTVTFPPVVRLDAKQAFEYHVIAKGAAPGDARVTFVRTSRDIPAPTSAEESTRVY